MIKPGESAETLLDFLNKLKKEITGSKVEILALRPKLITSWESNFEGDFDFIIAPESFGAILNAIYNLCKETGVNFILDQKKKTKKRFCFFIEDPEERSLIFEFWTAIEFTENQKNKKFPARTISKALGNQKISKTEALTLIYITHLFHKKKDSFSKENQYRKRVFCERLDQEKLRLEDGKVKMLLKGIQDRSVSIAEANKKALGILEQVGFRSRKVPKISALRFLKKTRARIFDIKRIIPIVGPDGVGKGIITERGLSGLERKKFMAFRFKRLYRTRKLYNFWLPHVLKDSDRPKNFLDEKIGNYIFLRSLFKIRTLLLRNPGKIILMDRYFTDYFGAPVRYLKEDQTPRKLRFYDQMVPLTPKPVTMIFMGCKNESLVERKDELPLISVAFLQRLIEEFIIKKGLETALFISTENDIKTSSRVLTDFIKARKA